MNRWRDLQYQTELKLIADNNQAPERVRGFQGWNNSFGCYSFKIIESLFVDNHLKLS